MTDSTDRETKRRPRLFPFRRRRELTPEPAAVPEDQARHTPQQLRLRLAEFEEARVADVMVPRAEIVGVELGTDLPGLIQLYAEESHSRLPVYRESLDDPIGLVHIKDVVGEIARGGDGMDRPLERLRRDVLFVPASMKLADLLVKMQTSRIHMALVVDEYGGTDGLVCLEDLMEEIVGDIEDEHDEEPAMVIRRGRHAWEADARMEISDFEEKTGLDLDIPDSDVDIDTLGGVAFALAGKVPLRGEVLRHPTGADIEILDGDSRRIERLVVRRLPQEASA
ncbi:MULTISPECIES: hemolysin family protein [Henriciella]|jgi:CBS domain containing-hemolysin-like protein|uniref:Ion transporter n=1 Tax=Henriciella pelagia TaxID=1977912 RepID=A0ABQ1JME8_9PROT|nr:hemolysin family protein [Henriciella pelagia]GGB69882.1 ion transporter [Henriciella pelagia]